MVRTSSDLSGGAHIASLTFDPEVTEGHVGVTDSWEVRPKTLNNQQAVGQWFSQQL